MNNLKSMMKLMLIQKYHCLMSVLACSNKKSINSRIYFQPLLNEYCKELKLLETSFQCFEQHKGIELAVKPDQTIELAKIAMLEVYKGGGAPLLIVPSIVNSSAILNLKGRSLIEHLKESHTIYLVNWCELTEDFNMHGYIEMLIQAVKLISVTKLSVLGYCFGSIMAMCLATHFDEQIEKLVCIAPPIDLKAVKYLLPSIQSSNLIDKYSVQNYFFLRSFADITKKYLAINALSEDLKFHAIQLELWANSYNNLSASLVMDIYHNYYLNENLQKRGQFISGGQLYDLEHLNKLDVSFIVGQNDKVVPLKAATPPIALKDVKLHVLNTGHTGLILNNFEFLKGVFN
jgi:poly(3-hydroxyalkanoate) synthetase